LPCVADAFQPPIRPIERPLRICVTDVFRGTGLQVSGTVQQGALQLGDRVIIMPQAEAAAVKGIPQERVPVLAAYSKLITYFCRT
jgi:elongation factor 1 alpha-like protein